MGSVLCIIMTKAVVIPFFWYHDTKRETSRMLFTFFLKHFQLWKNEVDRVYVIDSGDFLQTTEEKITLIKKPRQSHWQNLNEVLQTVSEDAFVLLDSDTIIYEQGILSKIFYLLTSYDVVSILDNSGGDKLEEQFEFLQKNIFRDYRRRFAPYLFGCTTAFWKSLGDIDFTPTTGKNWTDSMGTVTRRILEKTDKIFELPDDRTTLYYNDGKIAANQWLDSAEFVWSKTTTPEYGYYHIRNAGFPLYIHDTYGTEKYTKARHITPINEYLRLLSWGKVIGIDTDSYIDQISPEERGRYFTTFLHTHSFIQGLL